MVDGVKQDIAQVVFNLLMYQKEDMEETVLRYQVCLLLYWHQQFLHQKEVHGLLLSDQLDYLLVVVADTSIFQLELIQQMVVLVVEVMAKTRMLRLEKQLEFTEPEVEAVVVTPVDYLVDLVSSSFTILGDKYQKD